MAELYLPSRAGNLRVGTSLRVAKSHLLSARRCSDLAWRVEQHARVVLAGIYEGFGALWACSGLANDNLLTSLPANIQQNQWLPNRNETANRYVIVVPI